MMRSTPTFILSLLLPLFAADPVSAAPVTVYYSGTITSVTDPGGDLPPGIEIGSEISGSYVLDPDLFPSQVPFAGVDVVQHQPGPGTLDAAVGGSPFVRSVTAITLGNAVFNGSTGETSDFWNLPPPSAAGLWPAITFFDLSLARISDTSDLFVASTLDGWTRADFFLVAQDGITPAGVELAKGEITSLSLTPPAPSVPMGSAGSLALLALALAAFGAVSGFPLFRGPARSVGD